MPAPSSLLIRPATIQDIPEILCQRRGMYEDMRYTDSALLEAMSSVTSEYLETALPAGTFRSWLGNINDHVVAGGALVISPWPAHPYDLDCRRATILNVYTYPEFRRQGYARQIMQTIINWCKTQGFARVDLHASDDGRNLYESLGFEVSNEMRLELR